MFEGMVIDGKCLEVALEPQNEKAREGTVRRAVRGVRRAVRGVRRPATRVVMEHH